MTFRLVGGDAIEAMQAMAENSVDAIVTDPPYGLEFMGKEWDRLGDVGQTSSQAPIAGGRTPYHRARVNFNGSSNAKCRSCGKWQWDHEGRKCECANPDFPNVKAHQARIMQEWHHAWATEALRILKPGGHLLAFGGTRTYHRLACAIEDAGFEIRDCLAWMYGSGFPKSLDVSKAIDKAAGAEREVVGEGVYAGRETRANEAGAPPGEVYALGIESAHLAPVLTAPATPEAQRWNGWGTALKPAFEPIVLARKPLSERNVAANVQKHGTGALNVDGTRIDGARWPANVTLDETAAAMLDEQTGERPGAVSNGSKGGAIWGNANGVIPQQPGYADTGGASRFFYCPKADREERNRGLEHMAPQASQKWNEGGIKAHREMTARPMQNTHPTVKPVELMRWLCRMVTPKGGTVLDPFTGSGSTGVAAMREGFEFIGIEREAEYVEIARSRIIGDAPLFNVETVTEPPEWDAPLAARIAAVAADREVDPPNE